MNELQAKIREVSSSLIPIVIYVAFCILVFVPIEIIMVWRFLFGAVFLFIGLSLFLWGVDQSMSPIGVHMAGHTANSKTKLGAMAFAFILGFLITVAEPDLLILGWQLQDATGGTMNARSFVILISAGVGLMIAIGALQILLSGALRKLFAIVYFLIFALALFASNEFIAIAFDASGATTGALTTPFVLAISYGLSRMKGGNTEDSSFGLVGVMSSGPILATLIMAILSGADKLKAAEETFGQGNSLSSLFTAIGPIFMESLTALAPIAILFFAMNVFIFKIKKRELLGIIRGLIYSLLGLTFFLVGANEGFMDMGKALGMGMVRQDPPVIVFFAFVLGFIVVSAEPAVHVLGDQVEEVTGGHIKSKLLGRTLSIGVGLALALSAMRILIPGLVIWHILLPGFIIAIALSFYVDDIFVGIAFDAGGVASGPMAATFVLSFAQGIAMRWPGADIIADGFGVIAAIAMTPIVSILTLGALVKLQQKKESKDADVEEDALRSITLLKKEEGTEDTIYHDLLMVTVESGKAKDVVEEGRKLGANGATILHGHDERVKRWGEYVISLDPEKDYIWFLVDRKNRNMIADGLLSKKFGKEPTLIYSIPAMSTRGLEAKVDED